jgi:hypothetical protein
MIKGITSGIGLTISGGTSMEPYISPGSQSAGILRYNSSSRNIEVYDGVAWLTLSGGHSHISLDASTQEAVQWARRQIEEEKRLEELAKQHPAVAGAWSAVKHAQEQLDIVTTLVQR